MSFSCGKGRRKPTNRRANYLPVTIGDSAEKEWRALLSARQSDSPAWQYLNSECFSKYTGEDTASPTVRRAAAIKKWMATEERNLVTNQRLQLGDEDFGWVHSDQLIAKAREHIARILGPINDFHFLRGNHTNGASTRVKRSEVASILKHVGEAHVSSSAIRHWLSFSSGSSMTTPLSSQPLALQESSVLFTVPKNAVIDRVACKEPEINMFLQRIVGSHIRKNLRLRAGIDLNDQTINQRLAKTAYKDGLATIDLSSASDSISSILVSTLLPTEWWSLLDDLRVRTVEVDGVNHDLQMFSSMGNGFTFELESLLFYALTRAVAYFSGKKGRISVYGDDIIAPKSIGPRLARVFHWFGFLINQKKSNWSGPIRESCGKHYHRGVEVTPFYMNGPIRSMTDLIRFLNRILQWDSCLFTIFDEDVLEFHHKWSRMVPRHLWGGQDPEAISALVTGHPPRKRLIPETEPVSFPHQAGLVHWLLTRDLTGDNPLECDPSREIGYKVVDNPRRPWSTPWDPWLAMDLPM